MPPATNATACRPSTPLFQIPGLRRVEQALRSPCDTCAFQRRISSITRSASPDPNIGVIFPARRRKRAAVGGEADPGVTIEIV